MTKKQKKKNSGIITLFTIMFFIIFWLFAKWFSADIFLWWLTQKYILSSDIYLWSEELNKTYIVYDSTININYVNFDSSCDISSSIKENIWSQYVIEIVYNDKKCNDWKIIQKVLLELNYISKLKKLIIFIY